MATLKNPKHERFAQELAKGASQVEAYAVAGYTPSEQHACRLARSGKVRARIAEIMGRGAERAAVTIESILDELEAARCLAVEIKQPSAAVAASMGKAKVAGLLIDRSELTGKDGGPIETSDTSAAREHITSRIAGLATRGATSGDTGKPH